VDNYDKPYILDEQVGFILRRVTQRHIALFSEAIPAVTTTQFAALAKLAELGPLSQNRLGRVTAMDAATIKGVVDRLRRQGLVESAADPDDRRRLTVQLTRAGQELFNRTYADALAVTARTLEPLTPDERAALTGLLLRLA
jgi:MarR family transcriptional regulator, lower aerobic nicotinate degradation pathway regulator